MFCELDISISMHMQTLEYNINKDIAENVCRTLTKNLKIVNIDL